MDASPDTRMFTDRATAGRVSPPKIARLVRSVIDHAKGPLVTPKRSQLPILATRGVSNDHARIGQRIPSPGKSGKSIAKPRGKAVRLAMRRNPPKRGAEVVRGTGGGGGSIIGGKIISRSTNSKKAKGGKSGEPSSSGQGEPGGDEAPDPADTPSAGGGQSASGAPFGVPAKSATGQATAWPCRVKDKDHKELQELFGPYTNPTTGPLFTDATWRVLKSFGDKFIKGGRWLPSPDALQGQQHGLKWTTRVLVRGSIWSTADLMHAEIEIRFPGSEATSVVPFQRVVTSAVKATFGRLVYCVRSDNDFRLVPRVAPTVLRHLGHALRYCVSSNSFYLLDAPCEPEEALTSRFVDWCLGESREPPVTRHESVISVPRSMVEELYPRAAGRKRNEALLRDLSRAANVIVGSSNLVSQECKGRVAAKLAFLAMVYNAEAEVGMITSIAPGSLKLNAALSGVGGAPGPRGRFPTILKLVGFVALIRFLTGTSTRATGGLQMSRAATYSRRLSAEINEGFMRAAWSSASQPWFASARQAFATVVRVLAMLGLIAQDLGDATVGQGKWLLRTGLVPLMNSLILRLPRARPPPGSVIQTLLTLKDRYYTAGVSSQRWGRVVGTSSTLLSVAGEELLKRSNGAITPVVIALEGFTHGSSYLPTALMHIASARASLPVGITIHFLYNMLVATPVSSYVPSNGIRRDVCVDEYSLRPNEEIVDENKLTHKAGCPTVGRLTCQDAGVAYYFRAIGVDTVVVDVFRSCICNERAAVMSRVTSVNNGERECWRRWFADATKLGAVPEPCPERWLSNQSSASRGLIQNDPSNATLKRNSKVMKAFIKREKAVTSVDNQAIKQNPAPRIIQGRSVEIKLATGPWTWAFGKRLGDVYNKEQNMFYTGGSSAEEIGEFYDRIPVDLQGAECGSEGPGWVAIDCSRWDRSVGPSVMLGLLEAYKEAGAPRHCLEAFNDRHKVRIGVTSHGWQYSRCAQVSSGDGDTSCGNSYAHLVMLEACVAVLAAAVHGDDAIIYTNDVESVLEHYRNGGFKPVLAPDVDFCSSLLWPTDSGSVLGPKVGRFLAKTFYCTHKFDGGYLPWLKGVCLSLMRSCSFVPILRVLIPRLLHLCGDVDAWYEKSYKYKSLATQSHDLCEDTWVFFTQRYGLSEADVVCMEEEAVSVPLGHTFVGDQWVSLVRRDML